MLVLWTQLLRIDTGATTSSDVDRTRRRSTWFMRVRPGFHLRPRSLQIAQLDHGVLCGERVGELGHAHFLRDVRRVRRARLGSFTTFPSSTVGSCVPQKGQNRHHSITSDLQQRHGSKRQSSLPFRRRLPGTRGESTAAVGAAAGSRNLNASRLTNSMDASTIYLRTSTFA